MVAQASQPRAPEPDTFRQPPQPSDQGEQVEVLPITDAAPESLQRENPGWRIDHADALEWLRSLPDRSADLIITDPPYFDVLDEEWDNAWESEDDFFDWLGDVLTECQRVLTHRGSLYVFCSPKRAARVEVEVGKRFLVLSQIVWVKDLIGSFGRQNKGELRSYWPHSERIVFAEQGTEERDVERRKHEAVREVFAPLRERLRGLRDTAGLSNPEVDRALGTNGMAGHYFGSSQWHLPTPEKWAVISDLMRERGVEAPTYADLRSEYDRLRGGLDGRRDELEARLRPFHSEVVKKDDWRLLTDCWFFDVPDPRKPGRHTCEKPVDLLRHAIRMSSDPGALVVDPFCGSASTGEAALLEGRRFLGCEADPKWVEAGRNRLSQVGAPTDDEPVDAHQTTIFDALDASGDAA